MGARMRLEHTALAMVLATVSVTTCGGKVVVDEGGTAGQGGSTSSSSSSSQVSASAGSFATGDGVGGFQSTGSDVTTGDTGGGSACVHCAEAIASAGDPGQLCPDSQKLYDDLFGCACKTACAYLCADNVCQQSQASDACAQCIPMYCGAEFMACADDV